MRKNFPIALLIGLVGVLIAVAAVRVVPATAGLVRARRARAECALPPSAAGRAARKLLAAGDAEMARGQQQAALADWQRGLALVKGSVSRNPVETVLLANRLAAYYRSAGWDARAARSIEIALGGYEVDPSHNRVSIARELTWLAAIFPNTPQALQDLRRAMELYREAKWPHQGEVAAALASSAGTESNLGDRPDAWRDAQKAYAMLRARYGNDDPTLGRPLGVLAWAAPSPARAEMEARKSLAIYELWAGPNRNRPTADGSPFSLRDRDRNVTRSGINLARIYLVERRPAAIAALFHRLNGEFKQRLGPDSPSREKLLPPGHPGIELSRRNLNAFGRKRVGYPQREGAAPRYSPELV